MGGLSYRTVSASELKFTYYLVNVYSRVRGNSQVEECPEYGIEPL